MRALEWVDLAVDEDGLGAASLNEGHTYLILPPTKDQLDSLHALDPLHTVVAHYLRDGRLEGDRLLGAFHSVKAAKECCETDYRLMQNAAVPHPPGVTNAPEK